MAETKFKTMEWKGALYDFYVDGAGRFTAIKQGTDIGHWSNHLASGRDFETVVKQLKQRVRERQATVKVPFIMIDRNSRELRHGHARSIHAKEHDVLVTYSNGEKDQLSSYGVTTLRPMSFDEERTIIEAAKIAKQAETEAARAVKWLEALYKPFEFNLKRTVEEAISGEAKKAEAAEEVA